MGISSAMPSIRSLPMEFSVMSVSIIPGATALTAMFHGASSRAQDFTKPDSADLHAA
jgi:hypothetical protein